MTVANRRSRGSALTLTPISMSAGRRRQRCSSLVASSLVLVCLVIATAICASSAFLSPQSSSAFVPGFSSRGPLMQLPGSVNQDASSLSSHTRIRGRIRTATRRTRRSPTSLLVSLEPAPSTVHSESNGARDPKSLQLNATLSDDLSSIEVTSLESVPSVELVFPLEKNDETDEHQHMERVRMGDDVEELTHLLAHDQVDLQPLIAPSIPISYDGHGMVQADASTSSLITTNNEIAIIETSNGATLAIADTKYSEDYPPIIKFLFQKDDNGQTLASKIFNLALLAASFGYVFYTVFNIDRGMTRGWSPVEISMRIPLDTWASYENSLSEKPVATKTIINIVIYLLGDWLSQTLFQSKNILDFDAGRTIKNGFVGMCFGPVVHEYYEFSDWILPVEGVTIGITNRAFKILMDQTIYLSVKCSIYILAIGVLNGDGVKDSADNVKNRIKPIMFAAWKFWPLVHCVTYGLIPARHRILWVNSVDLVWNAILASKARGEDDDDEGDESGEGLDGLVQNSAGEALALEANGTGDDGRVIFQKIGLLLSMSESSYDGDNYEGGNIGKGADDESITGDENNILGATKGGELLVKD